MPSFLTNGEELISASRQMREPVHIYHIRVFKDGEGFSCHYTGADGAMRYCQSYLNLGYTVEIYMEA